MNVDTTGYGDWIFTALGVKIDGQALGSAREGDHGKHTRVVRDGRGGAQEGAAAAPEVGVHGAGRRGREGRHAAGQPGGVRRAPVRPAADREPAGRPGPGHVGARAPDSAAGDRVPDRVQAVHPEGEAGVARGTAEAGTAMGLSSFGSMPVETVAQANPKLFFQTYWSGTRDQIVQRMERARQAGAKGPIVPLDWSFSHRRGLGRPASTG